MSDDQFVDNDTENDPESTLITLDQLSQTIEVMTSVVNRLRHHLSEQIKSKMAEQPEQSVSAAVPDKQMQAGSKMGDSASQQKMQKRESFVVEINQQEIEPVRKSNKVLH